MLTLLAIAGLSLALAAAILIRRAVRAWLWLWRDDDDWHEHVRLGESELLRQNPEFIYRRVEGHDHS